MTSSPIKRLQDWEPLVSKGYEVPSAGLAIKDAIDYIQSLEAAVKMLLEYVENESDVIDGLDGQPEANVAMSLSTAVRSQLRWG